MKEKNVTSHDMVYWCQIDKKALSEGKSVPEARKISRQIGKATAKKKNDKGAA